MMSFVNEHSDNDKTSNILLHSPPIIYQVGIGTSLSKVTCYCNHLTSFASEFFVPPNSIDFGTVFSNLGGKIADNFVVLLTICIVLGLYIVVGVWARYKDRQDVTKVSCRAVHSRGSVSEIQIIIIIIIIIKKGRQCKAERE